MSSTDLFLAKTRRQVSQLEESITGQDQHDIIVRDVVASTILTGEQALTGELFSSKSIQMIDNATVFVTPSKHLSAPVLSESGRRIIEGVLQDLGELHVEGFVCGSITIDNILITQVQDYVGANPYWKGNLVPFARQTADIFADENLTEATRDKNIFKRYLKDFQMLAEVIRSMLGKNNLPKEVTHLLKMMEEDKSYFRLGCHIRGLIYNHPCTFTWLDRVRLVDSLRARTLTRRDWHTLKTTNVPIEDRRRWVASYLELPTGSVYRASVDVHEGVAGGKKKYGDDISTLKYMRNVFSHVENDQLSMEERSKAMYCLFPDYLCIYLEHNTTELIKGEYYRNIFNGMANRRVGTFVDFL